MIHPVGLNSQSTYSSKPSNFRDIDCLRFKEDLTLDSLISAPLLRPLVLFASCHFPLSAAGGWARALSYSIFAFGFILSTSFLWHFAVVMQEREAASKHDSALLHADSYL